MSIIEIKVPDIGDFSEVEVIELLVAPGDNIAVDQSVITVESDKASMEIPASHAGVVKELKVKVGDKVAEGSVLACMELEDAQVAALAPALGAAAGAVSISEPETAVVPDAGSEQQAPPASAPASSGSVPATGAPAAAQRAPAVAAPAPAAAMPGDAHSLAVGKPEGGETSSGVAHASPSVRRYSRELGVDLARIIGTGPKNRIQRSDVQAYIKAVVNDGGSGAAAKRGGAGLDLLPWPSLDFSRFGPTELRPLSRIQKISGPNLHRNWVMIPHITQYDEADVTDLEEFRKSANVSSKSGVKLTLLAFAIKASVAALKQFPAFNSSLDDKGENLILKHYYNIGFAADTPNGLVVPVIKGADGKSVTQIAQEMTELSAQARDGKLKPADMQGATFTISSLGGIGGLGFTPIINAPEVAILGLSRTEMKPVWDGAQFVPRLMMPMSLSYDHRVIDGALGARFSVYLSSALADLRRILL